jgi:hypothetical protein
VRPAFEPASFTGWTPFKVRPAHGRVHWCYTATEAFTEPFFEETITRCLRKPFNQLLDRESSLEALLDWSATHPGIAPTAFIFHGSRCGSTLFAQMATALPHSVVISEAPPVDQVLRTEAPEETRIRLLRAVLGALGQPRRGDERHFFVKLDAWHVLDIDLVRHAFPAVPRIYLYRDPAAVVASHQRMPGTQMVPGMLGARSIGMDLETVLGLPGEEYVGHVLRAFYGAALASAAGGHVLLMNYAQLPGSALVQLLEWCGLTGSREARERLEHACRFDAKAPSLFYNAADRPGPTPRAREIAAQFVDPVYAELESVRRATNHAFWAP